ncbi:MAG: hypothetical protein J6W94_06370 [Bacteroidales bacterium]|nr:hypothetical protein [Bacteroidales bacterium]
MQSYKKTLTFLAAVLIAACQKPLFPGGPRYLREPGGTAHGVKDSVKIPEEAPGKKIYITALSGSDVILLADGQEISRAPADPDPERHRARQGHLWTDRIEGKETVICRDGEEVLRFPGEELLRGFLIKDGKVHTLGQRPGNAGICYRVEGKEVFSAPAGRIVGSASSPHWDAGAFSADSSGIYYAYGIPFVHSGHTSWEYHVMKGADTFIIIPDDASGTVLDLRVSGGNVYRAVRSGSRLLFLCGDSVLWEWRMDIKDILSGVRIIPLDGVMCLECTTSTDRYTDLWLIRDGRHQRISYYGYASPQVLRKGPVTAVWKEAGGHILEMVVGGKRLPIAPGRYRLGAPLCINAFDSTFTAILSDTTSTSHHLLTDTLSTALRFSGVPTSIRIE